ncbi:MAG: DUF1579 domain-containing protein [Phycisphaeraceae bacterium]|nr:DUF1579 domain-containing protein [Phycisphaeraceae bacterium]
MSCMAEVRDEHRWLRRFLGEWSYEGECSMGPGQDSAKFKGVETVRAFGDLWVIGESVGEMPGGGEARSILTVGFNAKENRYVGSWIGTPSDHLWVYRGWLDEAKRVLTLETQGHMPHEPEVLRTFRDVTEFADDSRRIFRALMKSDSGSWDQFMSMEFKRVK